MEVLRPVLVALVFGGAVALPIGWLISEFTAKRWLRVTLGIATVIAILLPAHGFGRLGGEFETNAMFAKANTRLINATVDELDRGNSQAVLASLRQLQQRYHPNYENQSHFEDLVAEAVKQMQSKGATAPATGR